MLVANRHKKRCLTLLLLREMHIKLIMKYHLIPARMTVIKKTKIAIIDVEKKGTFNTLLEKAMAPHSSTLAWKIPWAKEPSRLQSMGSRRVGHDWATSLSLFTFMHWRRIGNPLQCSCLENPREGGAWWAAIYGVAQSWTRLKWLSSSSSSMHYWWECKLLQPLWKTISRFLKKLKPEWPYDQQFYFRYISEKNKNTNLKRYIHPVFLAALFTIAKTVWKQPKCLSTNKWIKMWCVYIYNGISLSHA